MNLTGGGSVYYKRSAISGIISRLLDPSGTTFHLNIYKFISGAGRGKEVGLLT